MKKSKLLLIISLVFFLFSSYGFTDEVKKININTATVKELTTLPGIGETIAKI